MLYASDHGAVASPHDVEGGAMLWFSFIDRDRIKFAAPFYMRVSGDKLISVKCL